MRKTCKTNWKFKSFIASSIIGGLVAASYAQAAGTVEVMHGWTSSSEAYAIQSLRDALAKQGIGWKDSAIAGDGGANAQQALQARLAAGSAPIAAATFPELMRSYQQQNTLESLDAYAKAGNLDARIPKELQPYIKVNGSYYSIPITMHRENMLWINKKVLAKYGDKAPTTWPEFLALAEKMKKDGIIPLALGGEDWQEAEIFSSIMIGLGGPAFYKSAIVKHDLKSIQSDTMKKTFETFRKVLSYADKNRAGRDWNVATQMVINGKAGMQIQGDWAKGEFLKQNKVPGTDFVCVSAPGNNANFVFVSDVFVMFKQKNADAAANQKAFSNLLMDKSAQELFNLRKGSISPFMDVPADKFDACGKQAIVDRAASIKSGGFLPSFLENIALPRNLRGAYVDTITSFANNPSMSADDAVKKLAAAVKSAS
ncbi:ABC transporter substrate-binding protein [Leeia sp. TBRC 13508]|uniref:Probable sugar-binding periplasmic protein n=1 Tax=Leeia speluncae TaxID=2884804 RepID=A0ABS8D8B8_9NEIS|nr:ABC transporter substrate-binding protein [Leeia speluncae]MCB6184435.1 ABC transporter substrate-binding protein [Leeia speluncae]